MSEAISPDLAGALLKAQREVRAALKGSENKFHGYKYASAEEVLVVGRDALHAAGLTMVPISEDFEPLATIDDRCGGAVAVVRCKYLIVHETGATLPFSTDVPVVPEKGKNSGWSRPADKATFGARTEALGYALRDLLLIPRENAHDVSGRRDGRGDYQPTPPQPPPRQAQPADAAALVVKIDKAASLGDAARELAKARASTGASNAIEDLYCGTCVRFLVAAKPGDDLDAMSLILNDVRPKGPEALSVRNAVEDARLRLGKATT